MIIRSAQNPKIQFVRAMLNQRKNREASSVFVVEGVRLVEESLKADWLPELVLVSERLSKRGEMLLENLHLKGVEIVRTNAGLLESLSAAETSQGILAVLNYRKTPLPLQWDFLIVADNLRDPGNLGTIIRTAAAARVDALFVTPGTVDPFSPKTLQAGMGAHFHLPIQSMDWPQISTVSKQRPEKAAPLYIADPSKGSSCWETDFRGPLVLVIGGEAVGAQPEAYNLADGLVHVPMPGNSDSLNAATAAAILIFEVVRQRKL